MSDDKKKIDLASTERPWDGPTAPCQGCGVIYYKAQLSKFGRHKGSPLFCQVCAVDAFNRTAQRIGRTERVKVK